MTGPALFTLSDTSIADSLRSRGTFAKAVGVPSTVITTAAVLLGITVALVGYNAINTFASVNRMISALGISASPGDQVFNQLYLEMFFVTETCGNTVMYSCENPQVDPMIWAQVWLPLIIAPIALILLIIALATKATRISKAHTRFLNSGFVSRVVPTSAQISVNRNIATLNVLAAPEAVEAELFEWTKGFNAHVDQMDKSSKKSFLAPASKKFGSDMTQVVPAALLGGQPPRGAYLTAIGGNEKPASAVVVFPNSKGVLIRHTLKTKKL